MALIEAKSEDPAHWARRTAARLRATRASFSDQPTEAARPHLQDEVLFALEDAGLADNPAQKEIHLQHLAALFPVFGELAVENTKNSEFETATIPAPKQTPVEAAVSAWEKADESEREAIAQALGLEHPKQAEPEKISLPPQLMEALNLPQSSAELADFENSFRLLWSELNETPENLTEFNRILKLLGMYSKTLGGLHKAVWEFWYSIAPREARNLIRSSSQEGLAALVSPYLQGKEGASSQKAYTEITLINLLTTALIYGVQKGSEEFSRVLFQKLSPENIENAVVVEDSAANSSKVKDLQRKCWDKYVQLNRSLTADSLDEELGRSIGLCMAAFLKNTNI